MFVTQEVTIDASFASARERLLRLARADGLHQASQDAYAGGLVAVTEAGPLGEILGVSKLVAVHSLDPVDRADGTGFGLRWEATGSRGVLYPVLDADISLTPHDGRTSRLALAGSYRPPVDDPPAPGVDSGAVARVADVTVAMLLRDLGHMLATDAP